MGVIFRAIADTIKYPSIHVITETSEEEGEFIIVGVVEGGGSMGPVAGGVGILFLVARMVARNIIVIVTVCHVMGHNNKKESSSSVWPRRERRSYY